MTRKLSDGRVGTHGNAFWQYERYADEKALSQPLDAFKSWFEYEWKRARPITRAR